MAQYRVRLMRSQEFIVTVDAEDDDAALDKAHAQAPKPNVMDSGWGQPWSMEVTDWENVEDFHFHDYNPEKHGETVVEITD